MELIKNQTPYRCGHGIYTYYSPKSNITVDLDTVPRCFDCIFKDTTFIDELKTVAIWK